MFSMTLADLISTRLDPTSSNKYLNLIGNVLKNDIEEKYGSKEFEFEVERCREVYPLYRTGTTTNAIEEFLYRRFFIDSFTSDMFRTISHFIELNERGKIEENDVNKYKTLDDLAKAINISEMKSAPKEMEKAVIKIIDDERWLVLRPLTFEASLKYGANTKWCTTSREEKRHFKRYWQRGVLIYALNKETGYKFAVQKYYDESSRTTLWNAADDEVGWDGIELNEKDFYITGIIMNEVKKEITNISLCSPEVKEWVEKVCGDQKFGTIEVQANLGEVDIVGNINEVAPPIIPNERGGIVFQPAPPDPRIEIEESFMRQLTEFFNQRRQAEIQVNPNPFPNIEYQTWSDGIERQPTEEGTQQPLADRLRQASEDLDELRREIGIVSGDDNRT
jgi:hypothetical protein